ncbi:ABC transporter substrate-binding protein [Rhizobiaceae bacterium BDR2-2]|uniref:ABC transporter substrate-binding protein n=1 Tax=Ectorhizobium quercum TaxID=2965071 RepID=A0AAE3SWC5_9HYPH|nr:ABC transporter substrate-binding protein [Ectorhizobium quercum]MCX8997300.1 ABC transporter substrate-binding protein [Ectorhizobium quercum]
MLHDTRAFLLAGITSFMFATSMANAQSADSVTIALRVAVNTLDPHMSASVGSDLSVISHIYPALILRGPDLKLQPSLAQSWEMVDDNTWRFKLTPGATFANGEKLDAAAVKWNLDRVLDKDVGARIAGWFSLVSEAVVVDDLTLDVKTSEPYPAFADQLSMFFLLPPEWTKSHNPATETMSGGPYKVAENVPGDHITLEANPDYWGEAADFRRVTFRTIPESGSRIAALMAGEIDLVTGVPTTEIARINASGEASADSIDSIRMMLAKINHQKTPMENRSFRQALNYAIDKEGIVSAIFDGKATVANCQLLSEPYVGYNPDLKPYPYDPEKARELLAESGVDLSQEIEIEVPTATYLQGDEVTQIIASQLQEVGLKVKITEIEFGAFMNKQLRARDLAQLAVQGLAWPTIDADGMLTMFAPGNVYDYWNNAEFGAILDKARVTTDKDARNALYADATRLMCDEAAAVFLYLMPATYGVSKRIEWAARGDDWVRAFDMKPVQ